MPLDMVYDPPDRNPGKPMKWMLIDAAIVAAIAFFSRLPEQHLPNITDLYASLKAFCYAFFLQLALERGVKPYYAKKKKRG